MPVESYKYLVYIGSDGVEAVVDIPLTLGEDILAEKLLKSESETARKLHDTLRYMDFRVRLNGHRDIHSYIVIVPYEHEEFTTMLRKSEELCDLVRTKGELFSG